MNQSLQIIPQHDEEDYRAMPLRVRQEFHRILDNLPHITSAKSIYSACRNVAPNVGITARQLYDRVLKYLESQNWKDLVNKAKAGAHLWESNKPVGLPVSFQNYFKSLCEKFQRNNKSGYRELMIIWRTGRDSDGTPVPFIPGYKERGWPVADRAGRHPVGWSYKNLSRFAPDAYDAAAARVGPFAASQFRPPLLKTRVGLKICERVEFDDHEYNLKLHFPGQPKAMRPRGFTAAEALAAFLKPSFKPTLWDIESEKKKALTEVDMMWFVIHWLVEFGYRTDERGTTFVVELGTAAIKEPFANRIYTATNEKVRVALPGMFNRPAHKGQFSPRGKGNFKHKPLVESSFNLIDNFFAGLPGQTGLSRLVAPEESHGREKYLNTLLKAASAMPDEQAAKLILPNLTWSQFLNKALDLYDAINFNPDHNLEGWEQLPYQTVEYRLPVGGAQLSPWQLMPPLGSEERLRIEAMIESATSSFSLQHLDFPLTRARNLSRAEVFHMEHRAALRSGQIVKLSPWRYAELMGLENGHQTFVTKQSLLEIKSKEKTLHSKPLRYIARVGSRHLPTGEEYLAFINPFAPQVMLLCKPDGAEVGLCEQWQTPCQNDQDAIEYNLGQQGHWIAERAQGLNERHADAAAGLDHMREHNAAVIAGEPITAEEIANDRAHKKLVRTAGRAAAEDILSEPSTLNERTGRSGQPSTDSNAGADLLSILAGNNDQP